MFTNESLAPGLTKNRLLTRIGSMGDVYSGLFNGQEVIIKQAKHPNAVAEVNKEIQFLREHTVWSMASRMSDYGIPLADWSVNTHFIHPVEQAITPEMESNGLIVLEPAKGKTLMDSNEQTNFTLPLKFHFAAIMGWLHSLRELKKEGITMDSNIDSDIFVEPDLNRKVLNVTKIDCVPVDPSDKSTSSFQDPIPTAWQSHLIGGRFMNMEHNVTSQIIDAMTIMYSHPFCEFLGQYSIRTLRPRFKDGNIHDFDSLSALLTDKFSRAEWNEESVVNGDNARLRTWKNQSFD